MIEYKSWGRGRESRMRPRWATERTALPLAEMNLTRALDTLVPPKLSWPPF